MQTLFVAVHQPEIAVYILQCQLEGNRFFVRWIDRTIEADAYVLFETDRNDQVAGLSMTKMDDGDYDFEDLELKKVK